MQLSIFSSAELPAKASASPDSERDWLIRVATSCSPILPLLNATLPAGWYGKTFPASCRRTAAGTLEPSSEGWQNSGMGSPTGFLTLSTLAVSVRAPECSWSPILEDSGSALRRFYFSANALIGIERRLIRGYRSGPRLFSRDLGRWLTTTERLAYWNQTGLDVRRRSSGNAL